MRLRTAVLWAAAPLAFAAGVSGQAREEQPPMSERAAAAALMDNRLTPERDRALALATELGPHAGADLKAAVIEAAWAELRGETNRPAGSEAVFDYAWAVTRLRDVRAIPFLIVALGIGPMVPNALADIGPVAFPDVMAIIEDPEESPGYIAGGLLTLRFMVEDGSLTPRRLERVREVARDRLSGTQDYMVVRGAVRLAMVLGDPELRRTVERIAADRAVAETLVSPYLSDGTRTRFYERRVSTIQEHARKLLAGPVDSDRSVAPALFRGRTRDGLIKYPHLPEHNGLGRSLFLGGGAGSARRCMIGGRGGIVGASDPPRRGCLRRQPG